MFDSNNVEFRPSLMGTLSTISGTAVGAPIDRMGFAHALGIVCAGAISGSTGATVGLTFKVQESAVSTGTNWTDITNEAISASSWNFTTLTFGAELAGGTTTGTWLPYQMGKKFAKLSDTNRQRYIRMHATLTGTVGLGPKLCAGFLLGNPNDLGYIGAVTVPSGNVELTKLN